MKKIVVLILALLMSFSMFSCADTNSRVNSDKSDDSDNTASPEELIIGTWEGEISADEDHIGYIKFEENGHLIGRFGDLYTDDGEYTITADSLTISWLENGVHPATYKCDLISLTRDTLSFSISEGDEIYTYTLYRKQSANQNTNDTTGPAKLIVGTWEGQDGFFTFLDNGHFACDFVDAVVGDGEYTITEDTLTLSWERNGKQKVINMTLILLTEETLSFSDSQRTYVLHKA